MSSKRQRPLHHHPRLESVAITTLEDTQGGKYAIDPNLLSDQELDQLERLLLKARHKLRTMESESSVEREAGAGQAH
jgi:hypothetical protein